MAARYYEAPADIIRCRQGHPDCPDYSHFDPAEPFPCPQCPAPNECADDGCMDPDSQATGTTAPESGFAWTRETLADCVLRAVQREGNPLTHPEIMTLLGGTTVGGRYIRDAHRVLAVAVRACFRTGVPEDEIMRLASMNLPTVRSYAREEAKREATGLGRATIDRIAERDITKEQGQ